MDTWQQWIEVALESQRAARLLEQSSYLRSSLSRYYYAAYQATTAVLLYTGLTPPTGQYEDGEAWSHSLTPDLLEEHFVKFVRSRDTRQRLTSHLEDLYQLRLKADYKASQAVIVGDVDAARRLAGSLLKYAEGILPVGE